MQTAGAAGADYRNRIWATAGELPFAGHPSLGTAVAVARARGERRGALRPADARRPATRRRAARRRHARASMLQEPPQFGARPSPADVLAAAGLPIADADPQLEPQVVSTGVAHSGAAQGRDALARAAPDRAALRALLEPIGAVVLYLAGVDVDRRHRPRARLLPRPRRRHGGPRDRLGRRPAARLPARARRHGRAHAFARASRWAGRAGSTAPGRTTARACQATSSSWPTATCCSAEPPTVLARQHLDRPLDPRLHVIARMPGGIAEPPRADDLPRRAGAGRRAGRGRRSAASRPPRSRRWPAR